MQKLQFRAYCWFWKVKFHKRYLEEVNLEKAFELITDEQNYRYLAFYFSQSAISFNMVHDPQKGIYIKGDPWQTHEVILFTSPTHMLFNNTKGKSKIIW